MEPPCQETYIVSIQREKQSGKYVFPYIYVSLINRRKKKSLSLYSTHTHTDIERCVKTICRPERLGWAVTRCLIDTKASSVLLADIYVRIWQQGFCWSLRLHYKRDQQLPFPSFAQPFFFSFLSLLSDRVAHWFSFRAISCCLTEATTQKLLALPHPNVYKAYRCIYPILITSAVRREKIWLDNDRKKEEKKGMRNLLELLAYVIRRRTSWLDSFVCGINNYTLKMNSRIQPGSATSAHRTRKCCI